MWATNIEGVKHMRRWQHRTKLLTIWLVTADKSIAWAKYQCQGREYWQVAARY